MDDDLTDQYEKQLYTVFKTFDVNNEEALDKPAVLQLCDALQLAERGPALAEELFARRSRPASFAQFRAALLRELCRDPATPRRPRRPRPPAMDAALNPARRLDADAALALCRRLHVRGVDRALVERVLPAAGATVGEFFEKLNIALTSTIEDARESVALESAASTSTGDAGCGTDDSVADVVDAEIVVEAWEQCNVSMPRRLLTDLGFGEAAVRLPELQRALDEEVRALPPGEYGGACALLAAALAVARLRGAAGGRAAARAAAERDKLRTDLAEANRRARLLAQEVDDNHARIEAELRESMRRVEARHADAARATADELAAERERTGAAAAALAAAAAAHADAEARLRQEAGLARCRSDELEARLAAAEHRAAAAERAAEQARLAAPGPPAADAVAEQRARDATARLEELRVQHAALRDRCDELAAALERRGGGGALGDRPAASWRDEAAALMQCEPDESGSSLGSVCPVAAMRAEAGVQTDAGGGGGAGDAATQTDGEDELELLRRQHQQELADLNETIEVQASGLEALREEVERCEQYWSDKLAGERAAAAADAAAADQRLADLLHKVCEYEARFERGSRTLAPLSEAPALEEQFLEMEQELTTYRKKAESELEQKDSEILRLEASVKDLQNQCSELERLHKEQAERERARRRREHRCSGSGGGGDGRRRLCGESCGCACYALWLRCGGAGAGGARGAGVAGVASEAAARAARLTARLAAAERLLADLYSENCRLHARLPPRPL